MAEDTAAAMPEDWAGLYALLTASPRLFAPSGFSSKVLVGPAADRWGVTA